MQYALQVDWRTIGIRGNKCHIIFNSANQVASFRENRSVAAAWEAPDVSFGTPATRRSFSKTRVVSKFIIQVV
jgi:hypothetical protein